MFRRRFFFAFLFSLTVSFVVFGKSLPYAFVYDDHTKILQNPSLLDFHHTLRSLWDRNTQSKDPLLNTHTYRPLLYLNFFVDRKIWGFNPAGYRFENILLHAFNGTLLILLAVEILGISWIPAALGCLIFLIHPAQVESVVWIVERSNLLGTFFTLLAIQSWLLFLERKKYGWLLVSLFSFILGLFTRENVVIFPLIATALDLQWNKDQKNLSQKRNSNWLILFFSVDAMYVLARTRVLGTVAQAYLYGGNWFTNLLSSMRVWLYALQFLLIPIPQTSNHLLLDITDYSRPVFWIAGLVAVLFIFITTFSLVKYKRWGFCLLIWMLLWFPTSQIFPLAKPFAERFLYSSLIPIAWLVGLALSEVKKHPQFVKCCVGGIIIFYGWRTHLYIDAWKNDLTLWSHALSINPSYWQNWYFLGESEKVIAWTDKNIYGKPEPREWREQAESDYLAALKCGFPIDMGAIVFLNLAEINLQQGKLTLAEERAQRGLALRPDLIGLWQNRKAQFSKQP